MGVYIIPMAAFPSEAEEWAGSAASRTFASTAEGVSVSDTALSDADVAALFVGYVPPAFIGPFHEEPLPVAVLAAGRAINRLAHATDTELTALTAAEIRIGLRALARAIIYLNARLDVQ